MSEEQDEMAEHTEDTEHAEHTEDAQQVEGGGEAAQSDGSRSTAAPAPEPTGHHEVDAILAGLDRLDGLEVHEHVAEFENAHQGLRRALDAGGQ